MQHLRFADCTGRAQTFYEVYESQHRERMLQIDNGACGTLAVPITSVGLRLLAAFCQAAAIAIEDEERKAR